MSSKIDIAVAWAVAIANDPAHGYDQANRWGPDYDCSSLLITAWEQAGVPVKSCGATRTANMYRAFLAAGFRDVTALVDVSTGAGTRKGDIWLVPSNHTAMMATNTDMVEANYNELLTATGGAPGDQRTGQTVEEIGVRPWHRLKTAAWRYVLRYPGGTNGVTVDKSSVISENRHLTTAEMRNNGYYIAAYLLDQGWTLNAIAGMLGNMQYESGCNPGIWESLNEGNMSGGYGLTQWTPASKYITWAEDLGLEPGDIDSQLQRIQYEVTRGIQYYASEDYPEPRTFAEFTQAELDPYVMGCAFGWNYERSWTILYGTASEKEAVKQQRGGAAREWYTLLSGMDFSGVRPGRGRGKLSNILFLAMASD